MRVGARDSTMTRGDNPDDLLRCARVKVRIGPDLISVQLSPSNALMTFVSSLIVLGLLGVVAYVLATSLMKSNQVPVAWTIVGGAVVIGLSLALAWRRYSAKAAGHDDFIIDRVTNTVTLPRTFGRTDALMISLAHITSIAPAMEMGREHRYAGVAAPGAASYTPIKLIVGEAVPEFSTHQNLCFAVVVLWRDEESGEHMDPIVRWYNHPRINALAHWLCLQCEVRPQTD